MAERYHEQSWLTTASLAILAVVALAAALIYTRAVMIPFVVALFIVALVSPIQDFQVKRLRLPRFIAIIVTLLVVFFVIALVSFAVAQAIRTIASTAGEYSASFAKMADQLLKPIEYVYSRQEAQEDQKAKSATSPNEPKSASSAKDDERRPAQRQPGTFELLPLVTGADKPATLDVRPQPVVSPKDANGPGATAEHPRQFDTKQIAKDVIDSAKQVVRDLTNYIFTMLRNTVGAIFGLISGVLFVSIFVIFLLAGRDPYAEHSQIYRAVVQKIRRYIGTKIVISAIVGILVWASLSVIGLQLAGVFGVLSFLLNFIPSIGAIIATLLPIPIAVAQFHSPLAVILVVAVPGTIHNLLGNFVEPKLMGEGLDLHPVTVLLALSVWGLLWGIVGMFLAVPITAAIRIVLIQFDTLRPIGNLLAGDFDKSADPAGKALGAPGTQPAGGQTAVPTSDAEAILSSTPRPETESGGSPRG
jgi:AI-2 transport protein TqsA